MFRNNPHSPHPQHPDHNKFTDRSLFIRYDQLFDDISTQIDITADMRPNPDGTPNRVLANATTRYASQINRWIDKYLLLAKSRMAAFVVTFDRRSTMNANREWDEVEIHLRFPLTWNATTFQNLSDAVHQYIVNSVLMEFFVLAFTSKDPITADKMSLSDSAYAEIKHCCVSQIPGASHKTLHPFG